MDMRDLEAHLAACEALAARSDRLIFASRPWCIGDWQMSTLPNLQTSRSLATMVRQPA